MVLPTLEEFHIKSDMYKKKNFHKSLDGAVWGKILQARGSG